ncbi:sulfatase [Bryobacter aggregatus]|uniref:sulfatase family protein n=1 Tax=Bryobacter aggregatus TaxID=360054 RepID=UPI00138DD542|nr:sulfatase [Bryobacter aggregatus]
MLTRRALLGATPALLLSKSKPKRPNIIWYLPDQWRGQALGFMGDPNAKTPHLDQLAKDGLHFPTTLANSPVCCPARSILLTGQYCHLNGMTANDLRLNENSNTMAKILGAAGYKTAFIGKWHLDGGPRMPGFIPPGPRRQGFEYWAANECSHDHFHAQYFRDDPKPIAMNKFEAEGWTDLAIEFLDSQKNSEQPFFLVVAPGPPHDPYGAPEEYLKHVNPDQLKLRGNYEEFEGGPTRKDLAGYYAACTAVDAQVGRLRRHLATTRHAEDTALIFSSDHGDMLGSHGLRLKRKPYEESIRVPGIIHYPRVVKPGRVNLNMLAHIDIPATTLGLCGVDVPSNFQGLDLSTTVAGRTDRTRKETFFQIFGPYNGDGTVAGWRAIRTDRYLYARYVDKPWVLFDMDNDPFQRRNLVGDPQARTFVLPDLEARLKGQMQRTGDSWSFNWSAPVEDAGRLYKNRTYSSVAEYLNSPQ